MPKSKAYVQNVSIYDDGTVEIRHPNGELIERFNKKVRSCNCKKDYKCCWCSK